MNKDGAIVEWLRSSTTNGTNAANSDLAESWNTSHPSEDRSRNKVSSEGVSLIQLLRVPAFFVRRDMLVVDSNQAAKDLFRIGSMLRCTNRVLSAAGQQENLGLRNFLTQAFDNRDVDKFWSYTLEILETGRYCQCFAVFGGCGDSNDSGKPKTVLVFIANPEQSVSIPFTTLHSLFRLTQCEARIAVALLNGSSIEHFSEMANISQNTARTHLKAVFQKTYTSSQPNLVSLLSRLVPPVDIVE